MRSHNVVTPSAHEPVDLDAAKLHLRVTGSADDDLISALISAARKRVEDISWRTIMPATLSLTLDSWPYGDTIELPAPPLQEVISVQYTTHDGVVKTLSASDYVVDKASTPGRLRLKTDKVWPGDELKELGAIVITYKAGVSATASTNQNAHEIRQLVSPTHRAAMMLIIGHLYENREAIIAGQGVFAMELPYGVDILLTPDRAFQF